MIKPTKNSVSKYYSINCGYYGVVVEKWGLSQTNTTSGCFWLNIFNRNQLIWFLDISTHNEQIYLPKYIRAANIRNGLFATQMNNEIKLEHIVKILG